MVTEQNIIKKIIIKEVSAAFIYSWIFSFAVTILFINMFVNEKLFFFNFANGLAIRVRFRVCVCVCACVCVCVCVCVWWTVLQ